MFIGEKTYKDVSAVTILRAEPPESKEISQNQRSWNFKKICRYENGHTAQAALAA